jgi:hypothetical protein
MRILAEERCRRTLRDALRRRSVLDNDDLTVIALWLGHETIETTHGYLEADLATKERALGKLAPTATTVPRFRPDDALLGFLASL